MFLYSGFRLAHRSLCCFTVGLLGFSSAMSYQHVAAQPIQVQQSSPFQSPPIPQTTVVPQTRVYQSPVIQGPVYQNPTYQAPGYYPQQSPVIRQPIGPVYQAPQVLQGTNQTFPPPTTSIPQSVQPSQRQLDQAAEQAALDAEKIAVLEKLLAKYKAIAANKQGSTAETGTLKQKNAELVREVQLQKQQIESGDSIEAELRGILEQMKTRSAKNETKVQELERKLAAVGTQDSGGMQAVQNLEAQVGDLEGKLQMLSGENKSYAQQLADSKAALATAMESQPDDSEKAALVQQVRELNNTNLGLTQSTDALKQSRDELNEQLSKLKAEYQAMALQRERAMDSNLKLEGRIAELNADAPENVTDIVSAVDTAPALVQPATFAQPSVDVSSYESKIARLTRKTKELTDSNEDYKSENQLLNRQLASLEEQNSEATVSDASVTLGAVKASGAVALVAPAVTDGKSGWGVWGWLIPFLAIGLGIAFFVILREEFQRPLAGTSEGNHRKK